MFSKLRTGVKGHFSRVSSVKAGVPQEGRGLALLSVVDALYLVQGDLIVSAVVELGGFSSRAIRLQTLLYPIPGKIPKG